MRVGVVGTGYVGMVAAVGFADSGNRVIGVDIDRAKVEQLNRGVPPIFEPGLEDLLARGLKRGLLTFTTDLTACVRDSEILFIAVGTPSQEDGSADVERVLGVCQDIARAMDGPRVIVLKSTVPVGTTHLARQRMTALTPHPLDVVFNPEFLKEGAAVADFMKPDRIVIGCDSERGRLVMEELYSPFVRTENPVLFMDIRSAEMTKYAANGMLATRISFMNEVALLCERLGADVSAVRKGIGFDPRIGRLFLFPGPGFGGSCFPKDLRALISSGDAAGLDLKVARAVYAVNERQKRVVADKVLAAFGGDVRGRTFALWGLAFKANTDDMREASSLVVIDTLLEHGATVRAYDPAAMEAARAVLGERVAYCPDAYAALEGADALVILTDWNEFRNPDFGRIRGSLKRPLIVDGRNLYKIRTMREHGFEYVGIGRGMYLAD
jgi:UDPglucose 6-dehydrogenase